MRHSSFVFYIVEKGRVLIIDDNESSLQECRKILESSNYRTAAANNVERALDKIQQQAFDVVLLDASIPGSSVIDALRRLKQASPNTAIVITSQNPTISSVVESIRVGAYDYLPKPFSSEDLMKLVEQASGAARRMLESSCIGQELQRQMMSQALIGRSEAMNGVARLVRKAAPVDSTVLITGETGVGKEVVARAIHRLSRRSNKPFVTVDCGILVESLFESELFGHVRGSFPGAMENTIGKIEQAHGGTLFLDEIASISINMQARLLRAVQEREITQVGSTLRKKMDVRIISATNRDLQEAVQEGKFREDLFYRLNVIHISVPPLRERLEDIPVLVEYYLKKLTTEKGRPSVALSEEAMRYLKRSEWPGNVRELINALEYGVVTCERGIIGLKDLPQTTAGLAGSEPATGGSLARLEQSEILNAMTQYRGNKTKAAEYLGINRKTLREKMQKYGLAYQKEKTQKRR